MRDFDPCASEFISSGYVARSRPGGVLYDPGVIMAGANIVGGIMSSDAAGDAADAQARAAEQSDATQRYFYDTTRADNEPFRQTGVSASNRLAQLMGLQSGASAATPDQLRAQLIGQYTSTTQAPVFQQLLGSSYDGETYQPPQYQSQSTVDEAGLQAAINERLAKQKADAAAQRKDPSFGMLARDFSAADMQKDPVYQSGLQFGLDQGTQGLNRQAAAGGNFLSGAALKALARFGNDYGSTKANESYNRFNNNQTQQYNRLAGLAGSGQQATNQVSAAGQSVANNISQSQQGVGNARASGYVGSANSWNNAIGQGVNAYQQNRLMSQLFPQKPTGGAGMTGSGTMNELASYGVFDD